MIVFRAAVVVSGFTVAERSNEKETVDCVLMLAVHDIALFHMLIIITAAEVCSNGVA